MKKAILSKYKLMSLLFIILISFTSNSCRELNEISINGSVINNYTKEPIANVLVEIIGEESKTVITTSSGLFSINDMKYGNYLLQFSHDDFKTKQVKHNFTLTNEAYVFQIALQPH